MQVWTNRHPALHQALPFDDYAADHNTFKAEPGHNDDSAHEDSGMASGAPCLLWHTSRSFGGCAFNGADCTTPCKCSIHPELLLKADSSLYDPPIIIYACIA